MIDRSLVVIALIGIAGCSSMTARSAPSPATPAGSSVPARTATATLRDAANRSVGSVTFTDTPSGLLVTGTVSDLGLGAHGVHLHAVGKCEAPFTTAGPHFNPMNRVHGFKNPSGPHLGDLGNAHIPAAGAYSFDQLVSGVTLTGTNALLDADGAAIVVHASADDYATDPSGNSGARIACGVITLR